MEGESLKSRSSSEHQTRVYACQRTLAAHTSVRVAFEHRVVPTNERLTQHAPETNCLVSIIQQVFPASSRHITCSKKQLVEFVVLAIILPTPRCITKLVRKSSHNVDDKQDIFID